MKYTKTIAGEIILMWMDASRWIVLLSLMVIPLACKQQSNIVEPGQFKITGKTNKMPDGTMLYLTDVLTNQIQDSVQVNQDKFEMKGHLPVSPTNYYIHTKDLSVYKPLWIETGHMVFDASTREFNRARVTGSQTHTEAEILFDQIASAVSEQEVEQMAIAFIKSYPANRMSASLLAGYAPNMGAAKAKELYEPFTQANKESEYGQRVNKYITLHKDHKIGEAYTDFEMTNLEGKMTKLSDLVGKVTLLEFWASWCGPCRQQNPELRRIYQKFHAEGFEIIGISLDFSKEDWTKAITMDSLAWPQISDLKGRNSLAGIIYGVNAIPDNYLIDRNGIVIGRYLWANDLEKAIEKALD